MVRVQLARYGEPDPAPTWMDGSVLAVPAAPFADVDEGQGGVTRADIVDETLIAPLDTFAVGAEVYVESDDPDDHLFDETVEEEKASRIWWRATVLAAVARVRVRYYSRFGEDDTEPRWLPDDMRAVPLFPHADDENDAGAIAFLEVHVDTVRRLGDFAVGDEILIESDNPADAWERDSEEARRNTHLWWR